MNSSNLNKYLRETNLIDYESEEIQALIKAKGWAALNDFQKIKVAYEFVQNDIDFGYNKDDSLKASEILKDGFGQCNTKGTLLMALLRALGIPCRIHGFYITKKLQYGAMTGLVYRCSPEKIFHSYVEAMLEENWYELEGFILDKPYLKAIQNKFPHEKGYFLGYGVGTLNLENPPIDFNRNNTYIQKEGIIEDFGVFDSVDDLLKEHHQNMSPVKRFMYRHIGRRLMNRNVRKIRKAYFCGDK